MVGRVGINETKIGVKMREDEELEMLLGEIPHATSLNYRHHPTTSRHHHHHQHHHHVNGGGGHLPPSQRMNRMVYGGFCDDDPSCSYKCNTCVSPGSGFSLQSGGSSSSLNSVGRSFSDKGSPTPSPPETHKSHLFSAVSHSFQPDSRMEDSLFKVDESVFDELGLSRNLSKMYISEEAEDVFVDPSGFQFCDHLSNRSNRIDFTGMGVSDDYAKGFSGYGVVQSPITRGSVRFNGEMGSALCGVQQSCGNMGDLLGLQYPSIQADGLFSESNFMSGLRDPQYQRRTPVSGLASPVSMPSVGNSSFCGRQNKMNLNDERSLSNVYNVANSTYPMPNSPMENERSFLHLSNTRANQSSNFRIPQGGVEGFDGEDSFIFQGEGLSYLRNRGYGGVRGQSKKCSIHEMGVVKPHEKRSQFDNRSHFVGASENGRSVRMHWPSSLPLKCSTLAETQGCIFMIAKDQHGCRFLQKIFDEGNPNDVQLIFNEIIGHVVELMINPFGNYLMQKLLEVCNEEQRMHILLMLTEKPGELVRISLNTHGTRVVQKLIETLRTRQQIMLVISALEPGFLALIKDLNGNHVIQRCLQCLSNEDNKFIFVAAAKYCVNIATHQHGCCVLQRCISHSTGEHRESLVAEISANGLLLAQDAFGNYVVQFILELKIPSAMSKLIAQFEGNFVHLSTQKFSSHVVEKCLSVLDNGVRSVIIRELLSTSHFEQLLQDPHANYVIQTALRVAEGHLHTSLVHAIESHKALSRNSPYSKRIFSHKLLKK